MKLPAFAEAVEADRAAQDALVAEMEQKNWVAVDAEENKVSGMPVESAKVRPEGKGIQVDKPSGEDVNVGNTGKPAGDGLKVSGRVPFKYDEKEGFLAQISRSGRKPEDDAAREEHSKRLARVNAFGDFVKYLAGGYVPTGERGESQPVLPAFNDVDKVRGIYEARKQLDADKVAGGKPVRFQLGKVPPPGDLPARQDSDFKDMQVGEIQKQEGKNEASLSGKGDKKEEKKNGFWDSYAGDVLERMGAGAVDMNASLNSLLDKMYSWTLRPWVGLVAEDDGSDTWLKKQAESGYSNANELRNRAIRNGGKNFIDLWKEGDYAGSIGDVFLQVAESVPELTMLGGAGAASKAASLAEQGINAANIAMGGRLAGKGLAGTIANGMNTGQRVNLVNATATGSFSGARKYDDLDRMPETKDMSEFTKVLNSTATGVFEGASEFLDDVPVGRWLYDMYSKKGKKAVEKVVHDGVKEWMQGQFKKNGVLVAPVKEGVEGVASQVAENVNDYLTGATNEWNPMAGTPEAFVYAVGGKALFSMKEIPRLAARKFQQQRAKSEYQKSKEALLRAFPDINIDAFETKIGSMPASDVYAWAKTASKPVYTWGEIEMHDTGLIAVNVPLRLPFLISQTVDGYRSRISLGTVRRVSNGWARGVILIGTDDYGTSYTDFEFDQNGRIYSPAGTSAVTSDIPITLPANGGNADAVDGYHAVDLMPSVFTQAIVPASGMKKGDIWVKP